MNWVSNLFLCATVAFVFGLLVFIISMTIYNSKFFKIVNKKTWIKVIAHIVCGFVISLPCAFICYLSQSYNITNIFSAICIIIVIFPTVMYMSPFFGVGALGTNAIFSFITFNNKIYIDAFVIISFAVYLLVTFIVYYSFRKMHNNLKILITEVIFMTIQAIIMSLIIYVSKHQYFIYQRELWINYLILHLFFFLTFIICIYLNRMYLKTQQMVSVVHFYYDNFIDKHNAVKAINEFINDKNVQYAFMVAFNIKQDFNGQNYLGHRILNQINADVAKLIYDVYKEREVVFFVNDYNTVCMFMKADCNIVNKIELIYKNNTAKWRDGDDPMSILNFNNEYDFRIPEKNLVIKNKISLMTSIYGVQTSSIEEVIANVNQMIVTNIIDESKTNVQLYDAKIYGNHEADLKSFVRLRNSIDISKIKIEFRKMNYENESIYVPLFTYPKKILFGTKQVISIVSPELRVIFMRHLAATTIQLFTSESNSAVKRVLVKYPIESLNDQYFSPAMFVNKVNFNGLENNNIVLLLNMNYLNENYACFINNVKQLRKFGVQIVCTNVTAKQLSLVKEIDPLFIWFKEYKIPDKKTLRTYESRMKTALEKLNLQYYNK